MITTTGRRHVVRALREALRVNHRQASDIVARLRNETALRPLDGVDLRTVKALVTNGCSTVPNADLYVDAGRGYDPTGVQLRLDADDVARWNELPLDEAYAIAADVHANRSQAMIDADDRMAAEYAESAVADDAAIDVDGWTDGASPLALAA